MNERNGCITIKCLGCGVEFVNYISNKRKYCSLKCKVLNFKPKIGEANHRWNSVLMGCEQCGKLFYVWRCRVGKRKYCSRKCQADSKSGKYPENLHGKRGTKPRTYHLVKRDKHGNAFDREWRKLVFERDDYTCQKCGIKGGRLQAHHKKSYKKHPHLRYDLNNGQTLCIECHKKTETYGWQNYWKNEIAKQRILREYNQVKLPL